jgi:hypothetical protein
LIDADTAPCSCRVFATSEGIDDPSTGFIEVVTINADGVSTTTLTFAEGQWKFLRIPARPGNEARGRYRERHDGHSALQRYVENAFLKNRRTIGSIWRDRGRVTVSNQGRETIGSFPPSSPDDPKSNRFRRIERNSSQHHRHVVRVCTRSAAQRPPCRRRRARCVQVSERGAIRTARTPHRISRRTTSHSCGPCDRIARDRNSDMLVSLRHPSQDNGAAVQRCHRDVTLLSVLQYIDARGVQHVF